MTLLRGKTAFNFTPPVFFPAIHLAGGKNRSDNSGNDSQGKTILLLGVYRIARIVKTAFGSGVKVTTFRQTLADGQVVTDTTEGL